MRHAWVKALLLACVFLSLVGCQCLQTRTEKTFVIDGFLSPESVLKDSNGDFFYVSNMGAKLEPSLKDSDGFISRLTGDGKIDDKKYLPKEGVLHAPKGMAMMGRTLFVADVDRVVGFNVDSRETVFEIDLSAEKTVFLNDIVVLDPYTLAVSATDVGRIYKITVGEKPSFSVLVDNVPGANGLYYDKAKKRLFTVGFGEGDKFNGALGVVTFANDGKATYTKLTGAIGALDGVWLLPGERVLFSDWVSMGKPGKLWVFDMKDKKLDTMRLSEDVLGPADFYYDEDANTIWLPKMMEGKVLVERVSKNIFCEVFIF